MKAVLEADPSPRPGDLPQNSTPGDLIGAFFLTDKGKEANVKKANIFKNRQMVQV